MPAPGEVSARRPSISQSLDQPPRPDACLPKNAAVPSEARAARLHPALEPACASLRQAAIRPAGLAAYTRECLLLPGPPYRDVSCVLKLPACPPARARSSGLGPATATART